MGDIAAAQNLLLPGDPTAALHAATKQYVDTNLSATQTGTFPAGAVIPFAGSTVPNGWLLCAGQTVSRTTYANLFAIIGTTYGTGDGSTTFNLPDLRGRTVAGLDNMGGTDAGRLDWANTLGTNGGSAAHQLTTAEMPSHDHPLNLASSAGGDGSGVAWSSTSTANSAAMQNTGGGAPHNNMQPTMLLNWIISTGVGTTTRMWAEGRKTTSKTIPDVTSTVIDGYTTETDPFGFFNTSTGKFTLPVAGLWNFTFTYFTSADTANWNHCQINNETTSGVIAVLRTASGPYANTLNGMMECAAGNVINVAMFADTASGMTVSSARFNAVLLGT